MQRRIEDYNRYLQALDGIKASNAGLNAKAAANPGVGALVAQTATAAGPKP